MTSSPTSSITLLARLVVRPRRQAPSARAGDLAQPHRDGRGRRRRTPRTRRCRRRPTRSGAASPTASPIQRSPPATAARRWSRSSGRGEVVLVARAQAGLEARLHERRRRAEHRDALRRRPAATARRGRGGRGCRRTATTVRADQQAAEMRRFHIIQPVVVNQKNRSTGAEVVLQAPATSGARRRCRRARARCPSAARWCPRSTSTHSGWSNGTGSNASPASACSVNSAQPTTSSCRPTLARDVVDPDRRAQRRELLAQRGDRRADVVALAAVDVAVDDEQHGRLDLGEAVVHGAGAEVGRARRPDRAQADAAAEEGDEGLDAVRGERDDPVAAARPRAPRARPGRGRRRSRSSP